MTAALAIIGQNDGVSPPNVPGHLQAEEDPDFSLIWAVFQRRRPPS
jgi:hypothetical protein